MTMPPLFFFLSVSARLVSMIFDTWSTWRPPFVVAIELTNDICERI